MRNDRGDGASEKRIRQRGRFATTHWSLVLAAGGRSSDSARALAGLCAEYWYPLYVYVRRRGQSPPDAQDLTQAFFAKLLENEDLSRADPARGRFRTFLLTALKHFLASEWRRANALKRGGGSEALPLDFEAAEQRYQIEPSTRHDPETLYARRWALGLLDSALEELRSEYERAGKAELFEGLKGALGGEGDGDGGSPPYAELAEKLGQTEGALRTATSRLRRRFRDRIRSRVGQTVARDADVDDEIRQLFSALGV